MQYLLLLFIKQDICIFVFLWFKLWILLLSTVAILLNSFVLSLFYNLIIELKPFWVALFLLFFYEWVIMATFWSSCMHNDSSKVVIIIIIRFAFFSQIKLACIFFDIQFLWEFKLIIDLYFSHFIKIVCEPFKNDD